MFKRYYVLRLLLLTSSFWNSLLGLINYILFYSILYYSTILQPDILSEIIYCNTFMCFCDLSLLHVSLGPQTFSTKTLQTRSLKMRNPPSPSNMSLIRQVRNTDLLLFFGFSAWFLLPQFTATCLSVKHFVVKQSMYET